MRAIFVLAFLITGCEQDPGLLDAATDGDGDGFKAAEDCNDADRNVHPDAEERCNGVDDNCDGLVDVGAADATLWYTDFDGDGAPGTPLAAASCEQPEGAFAEATDCADFDPERFPGADEACNGLDDDCDGDLDEGATNRTDFFADADADGFGDPETALQACAAPPAYVENSDDCNDADDTVNPSAFERCGPADDDCDGLVDANDPDLDLSTGTQFFLDRDGDDYGSALYPVFACELPDEAALLAGDCDDTSALVHPGATEVCNERDDDCDGDVDDADSDRDASTGTTFYVDADADGFGSISGPTTQTCSILEGYAVSASDCDDANDSVFPGQVEVCNGQDDNCDTRTDDDDPSLDTSTATRWWADRDGDGHGGTWFSLVACEQPDGLSADSADCDDDNPLIHPSADEVCDSVDNDCDSLTDDADDTLDVTTGSPWHPDADGDGWGASDVTQFACEAPVGFGQDTSDCQDDDASIYPGADEICDTIDNNCDDQIDDDDDGLTALTASFWRDSDNDGWGSDEAWACQDYGFGWADQTGDCNDNRDDTFPEAPELCDNRDNNCDGTRDEDPTDGTVYYVDADRDGYGTDETLIACDEPTNAASDTGDCDDTRSDVNPGEAEVCDTVDNDCNGTIDLDTPGLPQWYIDDDVDGWGVADSGIPSCNTFEGRVSSAGDCDDTNEFINPDESEVDGDGLDNDCNGQTDFASVIAGSVITEDTVWGVDDSLIEVQGNILIAQGATLTIAECTQILFGEGRALQVEGTLIARGSEDCRIQFTSAAESPAKGDWARVLFTSTSEGGELDDDEVYLSGSILEYVDVLYAGSEGASLQVDGGGPILRNIRVAYGDNHGLSSDAHLPIIEDSVFEYNDSHGAVVDSVDIVRGSTFRHNGGKGADLEFAQGGAGELTGNTASDNNTRGFDVESDAPLTVQNNWALRNTTGFDLQADVATITGNVALYNEEGFDVNVNAESESTMSGNLAAYNERLGFEVDSGNGDESGPGPMEVTRNTAIANDRGNLVEGYGLHIVGNLFQGHATDYAALTIDLEHDRFAVALYDNAFVGDQATPWFDVGLDSGREFVDITGNYWNGLTEPGAVINDFLIDPARTVATYDSVLTAIPESVPVSYPEGLQANAADGVVTLSWAANPETDLAGYRVHYGLTDEAAWALTGSGATEGDSGFTVSTTSTTLSALDLTLPWHFTVSAIDTTADGVDDIAEGHESWVSPVVYP